MATHALGFSMKHDDQIVRAEFEDEEIWRTVKQTLKAGNGTSVGHWAVP